MSLENDLKLINDLGRLYETLAQDKGRGYLDGIRELLQKEHESILSEYKGIRDVEHLRFVQGKEHVVRTVLEAINGAETFKGELDNRRKKLVKQNKTEQVEPYGTLLAPTIKEDSK